MEAITEAGYPEEVICDAVQKCGVNLSLATRKMEISRGCSPIFLIFTRDLMVTEDNFDMPLKEKADMEQQSCCKHLAVNT